MIIAYHSKTADQEKRKESQGVYEKSDWTCVADFNQVEH